MSQTTIDPRSLRAPPRRPLRLSWSDERVRGIVWQVLVVGVVGTIVWWLWSNTVHNLEVRRIATGFGFLWREAGLPIAENVDRLQPDRHLFPRPADRPAEHAEGRHRRHHPGDLLRHADRHRPAVAELAASKIAGVYIEVIRDLPLLLQLLFWYAILQALPGPRQALHPMAGVFLSNRGLKLPWIRMAGRAFLCAAGLRARRGADPAVPAPRHRQAHPGWPAAAGLAGGARADRRAAARPLVRRRRALGGGLAGAARLQFPRRAEREPGVFRAAARPHHVHRRLHRRDRPRRHPGGAAWPVRRRRRRSGCIPARC